MKAITVLKGITGTVLLAVALVAIAPPASAQGQGRGQGTKFIALWYRGDLVTSLLLFGAEPGEPGFIELPAAQESNDILYGLKDCGLVQRLSASCEVIDSVPGDPEYTGGRWHVKQVFSIPRGADLPFLRSRAEIDQLVADGKAEIVDTNVDFECPVTHLVFPPPGQGANQP